MAKNFTLGNKAYPPVTITNEIGKGKPFFFPYSMIILRLLFSFTKIVPHLQLIDDEDRGTASTVRYRTMSVHKWTVASISM